LRGNAALICEPAEFIRVQSALLRPRDFFYPNWPYPPTFLLVLAPIGALPYVDAFVVWDMATLLGCIVVVYVIVRRRPAIALVLASPYTLWNFFAGQNGFLTTSLIGTSLLSLERRPVLAGAFVGCLTHKPQEYCFRLRLRHPIDGAPSRVPQRPSLSWPPLRWRRSAVIPGLHFLKALSCRAA
jgi:hypothetical protein